MPVTVSFDSNCGSPVMSQTVAASGFAARPNDPVRCGFMFLGWFTDCTMRTPFRFDTPILNNTILYAKWQANFCNPCGTRRRSCCRICSHDCNTQRPQNRESGYCTAV